MLTGFGNIHTTEALEGALPHNQNSPQRAPYDLYAEQISGSAFTRARHLNLHTWVYRKLPSVMIQHYQSYDKVSLNPFLTKLAPIPYRFMPHTPDIKPHHLIEGLFHIAGHKTAHTYLYSANRDMEDCYFSNRDGEMLFVPYLGDMTFHTELGELSVSPGQIVVIPRGIVFRVSLQSALVQGYICENQGLPFTLPNLGPIGANGLANPRHFEYPIAAYEDATKPCQMIVKSLNDFWISNAASSPLNVVAWTGNYAPYRYDLSLFNTINTVSFDHPDPSIFTVLTSESEIPGMSHIDFVIFPPRHMVAEHTFRLPYFHRNIMSELMGLIRGEYDAKAQGFLPGGVSIHNAFTPHGPDLNSYTRESTRQLKPEKYDNTLAFMFETNHSWLITEKAHNHPIRDVDYVKCWEGFKS